MRTCSCQCEVPDDADSCPRCGALVPRGFLASLGGLLRRRKAEVAVQAPARQAAAPVSSGPGFSLKVEDVFTIQGRGTVVTGIVAGSGVAVGDSVRFRTAKGEWLECRVNGIHLKASLADAAKAGDTAGLLLSKVRIDDVAIGTTIERA